MSEYIKRGALLEHIEEELAFCKNPCPENNLIAYGCELGLKGALSFIKTAPAADVVEVSAIKAYLQSKLDEWNALGDRKFEPENVWGYNFIMACFDDLEKMDGGADI